MEARHDAAQWPQRQSKRGLSRDRNVDGQAPEFRSTPAIHSMSETSLVGRDPPRRVAVIVNPNSRRSVEAIRRALDHARPAGTEVAVLVTGGAGEATRLTKEVRGDVDLVVAVGGDGTVSEVAGGLVGSHLPLGIVPAGSTNIVAQEHGIPSSLKSAVRLLFRPHRLAVRDLGQCGERVFLHMAGAGLDARFFQRTNRLLKRHVGWLAYIPAAALALAEPPARVIVRADRETIEAESPLVLVANGSSVVHPAIKLHPAIRSDDAWLDVLVFMGADPPALARTLLRFGVGQIEGSKDITVLRARKVEIRAEPEVPVQLDGDAVGTTPVTIRILPAAIRLVAPIK